MIISQLKHDDKKTLLIYDELFEIAIKQYKKNPTKEMHDKIHDMHSFREWLRNKIETYNYEEDEIRLKSIRERYPQFYK